MGEYGISTKKAYAAIDKMPSTAGYNFDANVFQKGDIKKIAAACSNIFEAVVKLDDVGKIKNIMLSGGALCSQMSGSGSAVFGIFEDFSSADKCFNDLKNAGFQRWICKPVKTSQVNKLM
jgi:4-diphosphocytidyl-2-C-methyl-D-erythritol kinase